ncbi:hypothetical protein [Pedobacter sp. UBA4863]|nr:hypothetical protein [Pedobacter sp. UBA4863]
MTNNLLRGFDEVFVIDSLGKEKLANCIIRGIEAYYPNFDEFKKVSQQELILTENKIKQSCINQYKSEIDVFYTKWTVLEKLISTQPDILLNAVGIYAPEFKKFPMNVKTYFLKRSLELIKADFPIGIPANISSEYQKKIGQKITKEINTKFK